MATDRTLADLTEPVRCRYKRHFSDAVGPVRFKNGEAITPVPRHIAERLVALAAPDFLIVGPWDPPPQATEPPPAPVAPAPAVIAEQATEPSPAPSPAASPAPLHPSRRR